MQVVNYMQSSPLCSHCCTKVSISHDSICVQSESEVLAKYFWKGRIGDALYPNTLLEFFHSFEQM